MWNDIGPARKTFGRMRVDRKYPSGVVGIGRKDADHVRAGEDDALAATKPRTLSRPFAVWILIRALSVSIGMIVSAAVVTVTFLV